MTYELYATVDESKNIILTGVPFGRGERIKVLLMPAKDDRYQRIQTLKKLFKSTQALPVARSITEAEIAAEIAGYRDLKR